MTIVTALGTARASPRLKATLDEDGSYEMPLRPYTHSDCFSGCAWTSTFSTSYMRIVVSGWELVRWQPRVFARPIVFSPASLALRLTASWYAEWLQQVFGLTTTLVRTAAPDQDFPVYSLEIRWRPCTPADRLFVALSFARFATREFTQYFQRGAPMQYAMRPRELLAAVMSTNQVEHALHFPFRDSGQLFDEFGDGSILPKLDARFGAALHDFADSVLRGRSWGGNVIHNPTARRSSGLFVAQDFHPYYASWTTAHP